MLAQMKLRNFDGKLRTPQNTNRRITGARSLQCEGLLAAIEGGRNVDAGLLQDILLDMQRVHYDLTII